MNIRLESIGKKFEGRWVFRNVHLEVTTPDNIAIVGGNGSGKSTLLQIISGFMIPSNGTVKYFSGSEEIATDKIYTHISYASPYLQLEDDLTLKENIWFFKQFKSLIFSTDKDFCDNSMFVLKELNKPVRNFSSGMKQRLKLAFALFSKTSCKLFDEPLSNLDSTGTAWFESSIRQYCKNDLVFICSNHQSNELALTDKQINIEDCQ